jgi:hypothetical protein
MLLTTGSARCTLRMESREGDRSELRKERPDETFSGLHFFWLHAMPTHRDALVVGGSAPAAAVRARWRTRRDMAPSAMNTRQRSTGVW